MARWLILVARELDQKDGEFCGSSNAWFQPHMTNGFESLGIFRAGERETGLHMFLKDFILAEALLSQGNLLFY